MSDQRTHVEIEDVLSSIRRLVSQDGVPARRTGLFRVAESPFHAPAQDPAPAAPETLVLTPALRVATPEPPVPAATPEPAGRPDQPAPVADLADVGDYDDDYGSTAPLPHAAADPFADADAQWRDPAPADHDVADHDAGGQDAADNADDLVFAPGWPSPDSAAAPDLRDELSRLESTIAELEAAVAASDEPFEPERGDPFAGAAEAQGLAAAFAAVQADAAPHPGTAIASDLPAPDAAEPEAEASAPPVADLADSAGDTSATEAATEAVDWVDPLDPAEAELTASDWAEEDPETVLAASAAAEAAQPRRLHLADAQPEAPRAAPLRTSYADLKAEAENDLFEADDASLFSEPATMIDDEALRAMVSEIIRQELQGTLGERITRSVRKLVRREIARTLASRDFE